MSCALFSAHRAILGSCSLALSGALLALSLTWPAPDASAQTSSTSGDVPVVVAASSSPTSPGLTILPTTTTTPPGSSPTTAGPPTSPPTSPTTTAPTVTAPPAQPVATTAPPRVASPVTGVPSVPVGGPPATAPPTGTTPAPPPSPDPILVEVDDDLAQLRAISDYQPAQQMVASARQQVTAAGAAVLSARKAVADAEAAQVRAARARAVARRKLKAVALAAYMGVGYDIPGVTGVQGGGSPRGSAGAPVGLAGISALDAQEMLQVLGEHARQADQEAAKRVQDAATVTARAEALYQRAQANVGSAQGALLTSEQTLKAVAAAAVSPTAAAATPLPDLASTPPPGPGTTEPSAGSASSTTTSIDPAKVQPASDSLTPAAPTILGSPVLSASELAGWFASTGRQANTTAPIAQLATYYAHWGQELGVRDDVAFAQSVVETGYFSFPAGGQLTAQDNNFAGIGACDSCAAGWSFPTASTGVEAQLELLYEYATTAAFPQAPDLANVIGGTGVGGCCTDWMALAGKWASSLVYGISIMTVYQQMLAWVIPQRVAAAGLGTAPSAPASPTSPPGPDLAPLPGAPAVPAP